MRTVLIAMLCCLLPTACTSSNDGTEPTATPVATVSTAQARRGAVAQPYTAYGQVERGSDSQQMLAAPIEAIVRRIDAPAGSEVHAGDRIVLLDPSPATRAQWQAAVADAEAAAQALARAQRLRADGLGSDADVEAAQSHAQAARALRDALQQRLQHLELRAPVDGDVERIAVNVGDLLQPGATVALLSRRGAALARFGIDPDLAQRLRVGLPVTLDTDSGGPSYSRPIRSISLARDPQTLLASFLVEIPAERMPMPGQPLRAQVSVDSAHDAVLVPYAALLDDAGQAYVYVVKDGLAHRRDVQTGPGDGRQIAILRGLHAGETVVIAGGTALEDGMRVRSP